MKLKRIMASILCLAMVLSAMGTVAFANNTEADVWDGTVDTSWYNETDTEFTITTAAQLAGLAELVDEGITFAGKTVKLGNDLDLASLHFNPIGHSANGKSFNGTFDGQEHTIFNLYQQSNLDSSNGGWLYEGEYYGLFAYTNGATMKDVTIDGAYISSGRNEAAGLVGNAVNTDFSGITISNTTLIAYNNSAGGVASECYGECSFTDILVDEDTVIGPLWGTYDVSLGGVVGMIKTGNKVSFTDVTVECRLDAINDVASNYQYWLYRYCGMLIGKVDAVNGLADPAGDVTCENVNVTIGEWANYHYCEFKSLGQGSYNPPDEWKYARVEAGTGNGAIDLSACDHADFESHNVLIPFNQLFGGGQGVRGLTEYAGVNVIDNAYIERTAAEVWMYSDDARVATLIYVDSFATLQEAINSIGDTEGEYVIKLLKDIDEDVVITQNPNQKITIAGDADNKPVISGTIKINGRSRAYDTAAITIENIVFDASEIEGDTIIQAGWDNNTRYISNLTVSNCDFVDETDSKTVRAIASSTGGSKNWKIEDCTATGLHSFIQTKNVEEGFVVEDCVITDCKNGININSTENFTMTGTTITVDGYGVRSGENGTPAIALTFADNTIDAGESAIVLRAGTDNANVSITSGTYFGSETDGAIAVATSAKVAISGGLYNTNVEDYLVDGYELSKTAKGYLVVEDTEEGDEGKLQADSISIEYKDITAADVEGEKTYEVIVKANDDDKINELASVDISFAFATTPVGDGNMEITVLPAKDFTISRYENTDRYMFNYNGTTAYEGTDNAIAVATITVTGYGSYSISTAEADTNIVNATTLYDNLVDSYTAAGATDDDTTTGGLVINEDTVAGDDMVGKIENGVIAVPERTLTINITFPNAVENNVADYQDMTVTIVGGTVNETIALGTDGEAYNFTRELPYNTAYTVTVSGAGYRTARYTVNLNNDKQLNFWNNVMDEAQVVEIGKDSSIAKVTFLAGDIVKDNNINIYDLSAVVSYFGEELDTAAYNEYAKYDLNRDGVIDSKDVAYVLVSWNN